MLFVFVDVVAPIQCIRRAQVLASRLDASIAPSALPAPNVHFIDEE
jgi:hypothetical protein